MTPMRVKTLLLSITCFIFISDISTPSSIGAEQTINLSDAIEIALKQNREIRKTILGLESSGLNVQRASVEFMFNITPSANTEITGDTASTSLGLDLSRKTTFGTKVRIGAHTSEDKLTDGSDVHRSTVLVELRQPILRKIGRLVNVEAMVQAENRIKTLRRQFEMQKTDLIVDVVSKHEELLMLQRQIEYEQKAIDRLTKLHRLTQVREKQGRVTRVDSLRSDLKLGNARLQYNNTKERQLSMMAEYAETLGLPPSTEFKILPAPLVTVNATNIEAAVQTALQNRLDYAQIIQDYEDAKRGIRIARRNMLPDLNMISRYELIGQGTTHSEAKPDEGIWFIGLSLDSDFLLRNERLNLSEANINNQLAELRIEEVESAISKKVQQELLAYNRTQQQIGFAERSYQLAQDRSKLARRLFEIHKGDSFSVTDAEDELSQAEIQLLFAQSEAATAAYKLKRVLGTLIEYPPDLKSGKAQQ